MSYQWSMTTQGTIPAVRNTDGSWTVGTNVLTLGVPPNGPLGFEVHRIYLQRATTHDIIEPLAQGAPRDSLDGLMPSPSNLFPPDLSWVILRTWNEAQIAQTTWPTNYSESAPHSTFYYYRLSLVFRKHLLQQDGTPYVPNIGQQFDSNIATIVQPFELNICGSPKDCQPRLTWDGPVLS